MKIALLVAAFLAPWAITRGSNAAPRIVIVGAGASGIAAAAKLLEHGFTNVVVLEAENRIGGRIFTTSFFGGTVDLGAQWCHGNEGNIVYEMVKGLGLLNSRDVVNDYYYSNQKQINKEVIPVLGSLISQIIEGGYKAGEVSLGDLVTLRYNQEIKKIFKGDCDKIQFALEYLNSYMGEYLVFEGAFSWYSVSANNNYTEIPGNHYNEWKLGGYRAFLNVLMKKFPDPKRQLPIDDKILFYKKVVQIMWDDKIQNDQKATLLCSDGSYYRADHVIFTPSLGVLKHSHNTIFIPSLPRAKVTAIETLGINATLKMFLHFPTIWWSSSNFTDAFVIWSEDDEINAIWEFPEGPQKNGRSWLLNLVHFAVMDADNPNTLLVWFFGDLVPEIELLSDKLLIKGIMYVVNKFFHRKFPNISWPDGILHNAWFNNPNFRGTYSFETVPSRKTGVSQWLQLAEPLFSSRGKMTLLFAGEATHPNYYGNVHAAVETGFREARRIIDSYKWTVKQIR